MVYNFSCQNFLLNISLLVLLCIYLAVFDISQTFAIEIFEFRFVNLAELKIEHS